jgi:hypothetical protein
LERIISEEWVIIMFIHSLEAKSKTREQFDKYRLEKDPIKIQTLLKEGKAISDFLLKNVVQAERTGTASYCNNY